MNREEWDKYYLRMAREAGSNSKCLSRKIGALLIQDNRIVATGYNGPPEGVTHCGEEEAFFKVFDCDEERILGKCPRKAAGAKSGEMVDKCVAVHAERNALLTAGRYGTPTKDGMLVCYCPPPCQECMKEIIQAGIKAIVCLNGPFYDDMSEWLIEQSGIELRQYSKGEILD